MRALILITLAGCEHGQTPAGSDGAGPTDVDVTDCNPELLIEGELIDWESSEAAFAGVFGATVTQIGDSTVTLTTAPNGRLSLCAARSDPFAFTVDGSADGHLSGTLTIEPNAVLGGFTPLSLRTLTQTRAASFFAEHGLTFDPAAAQVVVFQAGDRAALTLSGTHDPAQQGEDVGTGVLWTEGTAGRYVLFPNVTPTANVQLSGDPLGPRPVPAIEGQVALVVISFVLE